MALYDGSTFDHKGYTFRVRFPIDQYHGVPWEEYDGHGPVSDWTRRDKMPGERVLCSDHGQKRYYDVAEATRIAKRDGWDALPYKTGTKGERAARAVEADFEYLRQWCAGQWCYVGVVVELLDDDGEPTGDDESIWGVESSDDAYLESTARELAEDILRRVEVDPPHVQLSEN